MDKVAIELKHILYALILLAAVYVGHYATIAGRADDIQCFAPLEIGGKK